MWYVIVFFLGVAVTIVVQALFWSKIRAYIIRKEDEFREKLKARL